MPLKTHTWISLWFLLTAPIIFWDVGYCFMRPRSMVGGDLHWLWKPYSIYQEIYGVKSLERGDGFTNAQTLLNVIETLLNLLYLYTAHITAWPGAPLVGLTAAVMTLSKTVLYFAQEYYCGFCMIGHNSAKDLLMYYFATNTWWIIVPAFISNRLFWDMADELTYAHKMAVKAASGKAK
ncbi:hypothetical protein GGX14DRAFT_675507 [Mycena pura]|uniref:EXPERA domain-containing protein n=1 Tax=Mycena pura TaxID=153505 RepID=A0AAD6VWX9_9AGAR|nr:hypothetical protein GGX14DRAFT_675507 [Mycena pura]